MLRAPRVSLLTLCPLAQPEKAIGHESQIEPWLALTTPLLDASETDERRYASKMNLENRKNRGSSHQYMGWMSERISLRLPVAGEVFFLDIPFYRTLLHRGGILRNHGQNNNSPETARLEIAKPSGKLPLADHRFDDRMNMFITSHSSKRPQVSNKMLSSVTRRNDNRKLLLRLGSAEQASYRGEEIKHLTQGAAQSASVTKPMDRKDVPSAKWRRAKRSRKGRSL